MRHPPSSVYLICKSRVSLSSRARTAPVAMAEPVKMSGSVGELSLISPKATLPRMAPTRPTAARKPNAAARLLVYGGQEGKRGGYSGWQAKIKAGDGKEAR